MTVSAGDERAETASWQEKVHKNHMVWHFGSFAFVSFCKHQLWIQICWALRHGIAFYTTLVQPAILRGFAQKWHQMQSVHMLSLTFETEKIILSIPS